MVGDQRRVRVLASVQQRRAADAGDGPLALETDEQLVAHHRAGGGEQEFVEARLRADRGHQARHMQRARAFAGDLDVVDMGLVADLDFERGIDLVVAARRALVALDQHRPRALADHGERAREHRGRRTAGIEEDEMQRPRQRSAGSHLDHDAVAHEGGVERDRDVIGRDDPAEPSGDRRVAGRQRLRHRADGETGLKPGEIGQFRHEGAVDQNDAAAFDGGERRAGILRARLGGRIRRRRERLRVAHQRAQVGVFPLLDPPVRQPGRLEALERGFARRDRAGQLALRGGERRRQRGFSRRLDRPDLGVHDAISS